MKRIIVHWTAGSHRASKIDRRHYHFIFEGDGTEVAGDHPVSANNRRVSGSNYAAHTRGCNSYSIGLSMACMHGATEKSFGRFPMTEAQFEAMAEKAADLSIAHHIPVTPQTVLSHAEVQKTLGIKQNGKWDFTVLPFRTNLRGAKACGDYFRERVQMYRDVKLAPPMALLPREADTLIDDADKGFLKSNTDKANIIASAGGLGSAGSLFAFIETPWVQALLIVVMAAIVAGAAYIFLSRDRKRKLARQARAMQ